MEYAVELKAAHDMTKTDYARGNMLCEEKNGIRYGIWFDSLEEAKSACIQHKGYGIIEGENLEFVWYNPNYQSEAIKKLARELGRILLPHH